MSRIKSDWLTGVFREYVIECLKLLGKDFNKYKLCNKSTTKIIIHHTKYNKTTIYDLMLVCSACNNLPENLHLA